MHPPDPLSRLRSLFSAPAAPLRRLFRGDALSDAAAADLAERLRQLVADPGANGPADPSHDSMLLGVFTFRDTLAREIMTPRADVVALPLTASREEALALMVSEGHSRLPVYDGELDQIVGILLLKDLVADWLAHGAPGRMDAAAGAAAGVLTPLLREPYFIPDSKRIGELLPELRAKGVHMAVVLDEFGGTEGLVTLEDILEEIVGDIFDEHDEPEVDFRELENGTMAIEGGVSISEVNDRLGLDLPDDDFDTVGGYVFGSLGRVPVVGDCVQLDDGAALCVGAVQERRITEVHYVPAASDGAGETDE
jgi:CBS domain containing-hemolysin-like protein